MKLIKFFCLTFLALLSFGASAQMRPFELTKLGRDKDLSIDLYILSPQERREAKVSFVDGGLRDAHGREFSTGVFLYVLSCTGEFYLLPYTYTSPGMTYGSQVHHSSVMGRTVPVCAAGDVMMLDGKLIHVDRSSGHFLPDVTGLLQAVSFLDEAGADLGPVTIIDGVPSAVNGEKYQIPFGLARQGVKLLRSLRSGELTSLALIDEFKDLDRMDSRFFRTIVTKELKRLNRSELTEKQRTAYLQYLAFWPEKTAGDYFLIESIVNGRTGKKQMQKFLDETFAQFRAADEEMALTRILASEFIHFYQNTGRVRAGFAFADLMSLDKNRQMRNALRPEQLTEIDQIQADRKTFKGKFWSCADLLLGL